MSNSSGSKDHHSRSLHVVAGVVFFADHFLIAQRPPGKSYAGMWEFPGGKIEKDETPESALKRELWEELRLEANSLGPLGIYQFTAIDTSISLHVLTGRTTSRVCQPQELQQFKWILFRDIKHAEMVPGDLLVLKDLDQWIHSNII